MLKKTLLVIGLLMIVNQTWFYPLSSHVQTCIFLIGVIIFGIPHGAADLLISAKEANDQGQSFSRLAFFCKYIGLLLAFLGLLQLLPAAGMLLFIAIAAFHFGETDLSKFDTDSIRGRFFSSSYGLVIIGVIVLGHFDDVKTLLLLFNSGREHYQLINWINNYKTLLLSVFLILFFCAVFIYFSGEGNNPELGGEFLISFSILTFFIYNLPMLLGLTLYFILWHSILSLKNIIIYLSKDHRLSFYVIIRQICFYSLLAILGISLFGVTGFMFLNSKAMVIYVILGLAVLTAPHINVMHAMYKNIHLRH